MRADAFSPPRCNDAHLCKTRPDYSTQKLHQHGPVRAASRKFAEHANSMALPLFGVLTCGKSAQRCLTLCRDPSKQVLRAGCSCDCFLVETDRLLRLTKIIA